jgi:hypothetical protein
LLEETGYHDIASIQRIGDEHHWINAHDGIANYESIQQIVLIQLASLDQKTIAEEEQNKHDLLWVDASKLDTILEDDDKVHHGKYYWETYKETISSFVLPVESRDECWARPNPLGSNITPSSYYQQLLDYRQTTLLKTAVQRQQESKEKSGIFS